MRLRLFPFALVALLLCGCGLFGGAAGPDPRAAGAWDAPTSTVHYRAFADADALASYLRWQPEAPVLVSAHRGGAGPGYPENAIATFERALNYAPALIEVDVRRTSDARLVLLHDETLDRTTNGTGPVAARTLEELRRLRLYDPLRQPTPFRIVTLSEALAWADGRAVLVLDVKPGVTPTELVSVVRRHRAENRVVVIAPTPQDLAAYHAAAPELVYSVTTPTLAAVDAVLALLVDRARLIAFTGVGVPDRDVVARLHAQGIRVQAGTFGETDATAASLGPVAYAPFLAAGVDVLATDDVASAALAARPAPAGR